MLDIEISNAITAEFTKILSHVGLSSSLRDMSEYDYRNYALMAAFRWATRV
jgi:hypothetical protein